MTNILVASTLFGKSWASCLVFWDVYLLAVKYKCRIQRYDDTFELCGQYGVSQLHHRCPCMIEGCINKADFSSSYLRNTKTWNSAFSSQPSTDHCASESWLLNVNLFFIPPTHIPLPPEILSCCMMLRFVVWHSLSFLPLYWYVMVLWKRREHWWHRFLLH